MRIISQDGTIDIPYEQCFIQRFREKIYFLNKNLVGVEQLVNDMEIATYSTEEKAEKAIEMLRDAYVGKPMMYKAKDIADAYKKATEMDLLMMFDYNIKNVFVAKANIFQFPKDEDVEV